MNHTLKALILVSIFGVIAVFAGLKGHYVVFICTILVFISVVMTYLWYRLVFSNVLFERKLSHEEVEYGTSVSMILSISNNKMLPLFGLRIEYDVSAGLELDDPSKLIKIKDGVCNKFRDYYNLSGYEKRTKTFELKPMQRGRFELAAGTVYYADPFGLFFKEQKEAFPPANLIVFPAILPMKGFHSLHTYLFGTAPVDECSLDTTLPFDLQGHGKSQNYINELAGQRTIDLILEQPVGAKWWTSQVANNQEIAIMILASLIHYYSSSGYAVKLHTNLASKTQKQLDTPRRGVQRRDQTKHFLHTLALMQNFSTNSLSLVLGREQRNIVSGSPVIIVTTAHGELSESFTKLVRNLMVGSRVAVVRVLSDVVHTPWASDLKEWRVNGENSWRTLTRLELL